VEIDFNSLNTRHRNNFNKIRKESSVKNMPPIDLFETYIIDPDVSDLNDYKIFTDAPDDNDEYSTDVVDDMTRFILNNMPTDSVRLLIKFRGNYELVSFINNGEHIFYYSDFIDKADVRMSLAELYILSIITFHNTVKHMASNTIYVNKRDFTFKNKRNGRLITNSFVFFSRSKKERTICGQTFNKIDWKHSWSVIGHWRKIRRLGKNRQGDYCVIGRTWVNPSIKGSGTFISKPRVCIGE
jgi:hypothetical protein